jgi:hypothetical protein
MVLVVRSRMVREYDNNGDTRWNRYQWWHTLTHTCLMNCIRQGCESDINNQRERNRQQRLTTDVPVYYEMKNRRVLRTGTENPLCQGGSSLPHKERNHISHWDEFEKPHIPLGRICVIRHRFGHVWPLVKDVTHLDNTKRFRQYKDVYRF